MDTGLKAAINDAGGQRALARLLGISHTAIQYWDRVPLDWLILVEKATNVRRDRLRPDLFAGYEPKRTRRRHRSK